MENNQNQQIEQIDLQRIAWGFLKQLRRLWWVIVILAILGGLFMYNRAEQSYRPMYQAQAVFSVSVSYGKGTDIMDYVNYYDYTAAKLAADTFPYLLRSEAMTQRLQQKLGVSYINGSVSASSLGGGTNFFRLTVTSADPQAAYDILRAVMEVYPQISRQVIGQTQFKVNREPVVPVRPYNSFSWKRDVALGVAAGVVAGAGILLVLALLTGTVYKPDELKKHTNLACLATVPNVRIKQRKNSEAAPLLTTLMDDEDPFCEAFHLLRVKLLRQMEEKQEKVILFTSSLPSEGKSCLAANTALALARIGKRVLLVDADLRIQNLKHTLNIDIPSCGLVELLSGKDEQAAPIAVGDTGLYLLAGDAPVRNPSALLRHDRLRSVLEALRPQYDYIVIDTPPSLMMADASAIGRYADRVVYVVRQDYATRSQIVDGIQNLSAAGASIAGFVFNRAASGGSGHYGYGYSYRYGYSKRYGYSNRYGYADRKERK